MTSFALIACDHGFGHVRRCLLIARALVARGMSVTLFAPASATARFMSTEELTTARIASIDFHTGTSVASLRGNDPAPCWSERLPSLQGFDVVLCDNLPEILKVRPDAVLSGSFLWHLVLDEIAPHIYARAELLLSVNRPRMIASAVFGMPNLAERTRLTLVGLCVANVPPKSAGDDLLVACGGTKAMEQAFQDLVRAIAMSNGVPFRTVMVEPRLMPSNAPRWMQPARFDEQMYSGLAATVCRPGVGTMTDCVWAGARTFSTWELGNRELTFNAARFVELGIGESAGSPPEAFRSACEFMTDTSRRALHAAAANRINFDGANETADALLEVHKKLDASNVP